MGISSHIITVFMGFLVIWITGWMVADFDINKLVIAMMSWIAMYMWHTLAYK